MRFYKAIALFLALGGAPMLAVGCADDDDDNPDASVSPDAAPNADAAARPDARADAGPGPDDTGVGPDDTGVGPDDTGIGPDATPGDTGMTTRPKCSEFVIDLILNRTNGTGSPVALPNAADCDEAEDQAEYQSLF